MLLLLSLAAILAAPPPLEPLAVAADGKGFVLATSHAPFHPWGLNYGHAGALIEDFWDRDWDTLAADFAKMKALGANLVRVHLQVGRFMDGPDSPNAHALAQLGRLLDLARQTGLRLDLTGLACYRPADAPAWYEGQDEAAHWATQAAFWRAVAGQVDGNPAVFCYDLANEPIVPGQPVTHWSSGQLFGGYDFVQFVVRDPAGRTRSAIAAAWIERLKAAIRERDRRTPITLGMLPWTTGWGHLSGFVPAEVAPRLDFLSVHLYPKSKDPAEAERGLRECAVGKPLLIEETFPLSCSSDELTAFLRASRSAACGWVWHFDGRTPEDYDEIERAGKLTLSDAVWRAALRLFRQLGPEFGK
jgi:hypothetical protein